MRRQAAALFCAGALERARPDPEGAPVRAYQQRGQSWRGCEGVLLLPRQYADALLHEVPLQVSAARVSLPGPGRDQPEAHRGRSSNTNCSIPASSTTTDISTCSSNTPKKARKTCSSESLCTIAGPKPPGCACCRHYGFATPGPGVGTIASLRCAKRGPAPFGPHTMSWASTGSIAMVPRNCSSPRMRATPNVSGASPTLLPTSRMGSMPTSSLESGRQ